MSDSTFNYEEYEIECERIRKDNEQLLAEFSGDINASSDVAPELINKYGENNIFFILDRFDEMSEAEKNAAVSNPETFFGFLILNRTPAYDYRSVLISMEVSDLHEIADGMGIENQFKMKKTKLINSIYDKFMSFNVFDLLAGSIDDKYIKLIDEIMTGDVEYHITDPDFPYDLAVTLLSFNAITAFFDGYDIYIIPIDEAKEKYAEFLSGTDGMLNDLISELDSYASAATNLYGMIKLDEFFEIYASQTGVVFENDTGRDRLIQLLDVYKSNGAEADYRLFDDLLISDNMDYASKEEFAQLMELFQRHPRAIFPKEHFLKYKDWYYYDETEAHIKIIKYLEKKLDGDDSKEKARSLTSEICGIYRELGSLEECIDLLRSYEVTFDTNADKELASGLLTDVYNHTKIWGNNGLTSIEIRELIKSERMQEIFEAQKNKQGSSDFCPCGSGKKYKNCCGKPVN